MSSDKENEYFSDGITEEILNALSKIEGLHVTARTSSFAFKNQNIDAREIGKKLNVSLILEGSIRKSENFVRITAQLVKAENGYHIWSDTWDRELKNIFILQDEIATIIAEKINTDIKPAQSDTEYILKNTDALDLYLKGTYLLNKWDFKEAENVIAYFEQALEIDPEFIKAYIGLCNCYTWLSATGMMNPEDAHKKVEYCINEVLRLDPDMPDMYSVIAGKNYWIEWNIPLALENINKALKLKPSFYDALLYKGMILASLDRVEESLDSFFHAERLNPFADTINYCLGFIYCFTGEVNKSLEYIEKNIQICPYWYAQYITKIEALCELNRFDEAWAIILALEDDPNSPLSIAELKAYYFASLGEKDKAYEQIKIIENELENNPIVNASAPQTLSAIYIKLGEIEKALGYLEYGMEHGATPFLFIKIDSLWDQLRDNPRYLNAIKKINYSIEKIKIEDISKKYKKSTLSKKQAELIKNELNTYVVTEKSYLNPKLNLSDLAESVNVSINQLSQLLNEYIGKNFYDYVNTYRLEYLINLSKDPKYKKFTLLALAYESGFNSKTTFNLFFKKTLGTTPSDYFKTTDS